MAVKGASTMDSINGTHNSDSPSLEFLLNIWPVTSSIASHATAGDLLSLSRASSGTRAAVHGSSFERKSLGTIYDPHSIFRGLCIGQHQTPQWLSLKASADFVCSVPTHKEPKSSTTKVNVVRPCKFCSRPICSTCKVRSWFVDKTQSQKAFKYRTRYLCTKCWQTGNLRKDFRYPAESVTREHIFQGRSYDQRGGRCTCSGGDDNWVCNDCRTLEIASGPDNTTLDDARRQKPSIREPWKPHEDGQVEALPCYGLNCTNIIADYNKDRRRICLWCSKGLPRQFAGESRLRWQQGQVEVRAINAESRSRDMLEYNRNRFKALTISRRELRGTDQCVLLNGRDGPEHDETLFVRHLDAVNYRALVGDTAAPAPDDVYQSKMGKWRYSAEFLKAAGRQMFLRKEPFVDEQYLQSTTREGSCPEARQNKAFKVIAGKHSWDIGAPEEALINMSVVCFQAGIMTPEELANVNNRKYRWPRQDLLKQLVIDLGESLKVWEESTEGDVALREPIPFSELLLKSRAAVRGFTGLLVPLEPPPACGDGTDVSPESLLQRSLDTTVDEDAAWGDTMNDSDSDIDSESSRKRSSFSTDEPKKYRPQWC